MLKPRHSHILSAAIIVALLSFPAAAPAEQYHDRVAPGPIEPTPNPLIDYLQGFCEENDCTQYHVSFRLRLDMNNLPNPYDGNRFFVGDLTEDFLELHYSRFEVPPRDVMNSAGEEDWEIWVLGASIKYLEAGDPHMPHNIYLEASLDSMTFIPPGSNVTSLDDNNLFIEIHEPPCCPPPPKKRSVR